MICPEELIIIFALRTEDLVFRRVAANHLKIPMYGNRHLLCKKGSNRQSKEYRKTLLKIHHTLVGERLAPRKVWTQMEKRVSYMTDTLMEVGLIKI